MAQCVFLDQGPVSDNGYGSLDDESSWLSPSSCGSSPATTPGTSPDWLNPPKFNFDVFASAAGRFLLDFNLNQ